MENKHGIKLYRQDLPGFGEPGFGNLDGFQWINTDIKSGGIVGVFKQFLKVDDRKIFGHCKKRCSCLSIHVKNYC